MGTESNGPPLIVRDLEVVRGGRTVLDGVGFELGLGLVTGLLGPSGSGKTTLMRTIVGVQANARGRVEVLGQPAGAPGLRRRVGYVTQAPSVYGDLTVAENLAYFARIFGRGGGEVMATLETVGLSDQAGAVVDRLSGGQRSRVSLATALVGDPDLLVLDEPTVGLDPVLRRELWEHFHRLADDGKTLLVSSHVMDEAQRCDRLLLLHEGRLLAHGPPEQFADGAGAAGLEAAFIALIEGGAGP